MKYKSFYTFIYLLFGSLKSVITFQTFIKPLIASLIEESRLLRAFWEIFVMV